MEILWQIVDLEIILVDGICEGARLNCRKSSRFVPIDDPNTSKMRLSEYHKKKKMESRQ